MSFLSISYIILNKKKNKNNRKRGTALILIPVFLLSGPSVKKPGTKKPYRRQSAVGHKRMIKEA